MEIKHLRLIETISQEGSLSKAAEKLYLTQSALSHQLKEVELHIGTQAFLRINKKLVMTDAGNILLAGAKRILREVENVELELKKHTSGDTGNLSICTECYTCYHWLPAIIKKFNCQFPNIDVLINTENTKKPLDLLLEGKLDVAIVHRMVKDNSIQYADLFTDELVAVLPNGHPLAKFAILQPEHFTDQTIITHSKKFEQGTIYERLLKPSNIRVKKMIYVQLTEASIEMVKAGLGISVMAKWAMKPYMEANLITTRRVTRKGLTRKWYAATLRSVKQPTYLSSFMQILQEGINL